MANPTHSEIENTLQTTDTSVNSLLVGAAVGSTTCSGGIKCGPIAATSTVSDSVGSMTTIRAGGIGIASQASLDFIFASSATQLGRLGSGAAAQSVRRNSTNTAWEFFDSAAIIDMTGGRLTLETAVPVSTTDQSAKTTLFYTPDAHNLISLYDGAAWQTIAFAEISITLAALTASKPYDVFCFSNAGTATLELLVWTNTTTRATALVRQDGRLVKSGVTTRRYLGTIYINASGGQSDDTYAARYVWNAYNRVVRPMRVPEGTNSWSYSTNTFRQANAAATNQLDFVVGLPEVSATARVIATAAAGSGGLRFLIGIGLDSTTVNTTGALRGVGETNAAVQTSVYADVTTYPGIGRHTLVYLESAGPDGGTFTWYGNGGGSDFQSGIDGWLEN